MNISEISDESKLEKPNRVRRAVYVFGLTFVSFLLITYLNVMVDEPNKLNEITVDGLLTLIMAIMGFYLSTTSIDTRTLMQAVSTKIAAAKSKVYG